MNLEDYFKTVLKGVVGAIAVVIILTSILSFVDINSSVLSIITVIITSVSLIFGTIFAVKLYRRKGWLIGLSVGTLFYISLYAIGILFGAEATLGLYDLVKFLLCVIVGILSGMLGINLGKKG